MDEFEFGAQVVWIRNIHRYRSQDACDDRGLRFEARGVGDIDRATHQRSDGDAPLGSDSSKPFTLLGLNEHLKPLGLHAHTVVGACIRTSGRSGEGWSAALRARLSGYLVPKLVREIAGDTGKRPL